MPARKNSEEEFDPEKVIAVGLARVKGQMYYVKDGQIWSVGRKRDGVPKGRPQMVVDAQIEMDTNYIYFVDRDGDIARVSREAGPKRERYRPSSKQLLYTLFPTLDIPKHTKDIRLIQDEATNLFIKVAAREDLERLSPRQLEELLAEVFHREGYEAHLTPPSKDGGRDVIAVLPGPLPYLVVAEAKRMRLVKPNLVQALWGVRDRDKAHVGLLATTGRFSDDTRKMVVKTWGRQMDLRDGEQFMAWIRKLKAKDLRRH